MTPNEIDPITRPMQLDVAENGDVMATWLFVGEPKHFTIPADNMIEFLEWQAEPHRKSWEESKRRGIAKGAASRRKIPKGTWGAGESDRIVGAGDSDRIIG